LRPVASGVARLLAVRAPVSVTTSTIMIEPSAPGRAFVNHAFGVVSTRSEGFVFAVLARAFAGEDLGAPTLGFSLRDIVAARTPIVGPVELARATAIATRATIVTAVELSRAAIVAPRATVVAPVELARATIITPSLATRATIITPIITTRATIIRPIITTRATFITTRTAAITPVVTPRLSVVTARSPSVAFGGAGPKSSATTVRVSPTGIATLA
jgi:hypothetical protein